MSGETKDPKPSLLELAGRVHRGELTPEEAARILTASETRKLEEPSA